MNNMDALFETKYRTGGLSIMDRVDVSGDCWEWQGGRRNGYGATWYDGKIRYVHRVVWGALVGRIPKGLVIDHLCRNLICCNPDHLEVVTVKTNTNRGFNWNRNKTHCKWGHPLSGDNLYIIPSSGQRSCRACVHERPYLLWAERNGVEAVVREAGKIAV